MEAWLIDLSAHHAFWVYFLIIALAFVEGPIVSMILGVLIKLGYFPFIPIYIALMVGDVLGDSTWYLVGRKWGHAFIRKFGKYVSVTEDKVEMMIRVFHKYKNHILIISKITNGFGLSLVTLIAAGMARIPFLHYFTLNLIGQFIWTGLLVGVGYFFSGLYMEINGVMGKIGVIVGFVVLIGLFLGFINYMKNRSKSV
jgi:membrane-associated protein